MLGETPLAAPTGNVWICASIDIARNAMRAITTAFQLKMQNLGPAPYLSRQLPATNGIAQRRAGSQQVLRWNRRPDLRSMVLPRFSLAAVADPGPSPRPPERRRHSRLRSAYCKFTKVKWIRAG